MKSRTVRLGEVVRIEGGGTPSRDRADYFGGSIPWMTVKDFGDELRIRRTQESITASGLDNSASRLIPAGNVIVGTRMSVGRAVVNLVDLAINQDLKALMCDGKLHPEYLNFCLAFLRPKLSAQATGATVKGITIDDIQNLCIPLPSLPEQRRIAAVLEQADRLRRTRRSALDLADSFLPTAFLEMFCSGERPIESSLLEDLAATRPGAIRTGPFGSQLLHSEFVDSGVAVLGIDNAVNNCFEWRERRYISSEKYAALRRYTVFPEDVLITIMGTCGRCAIVPSDIPMAINTKHLCCITLNQAKCIPRYLQSAFLHHPHVRRQLSVATKGAIMEGLNMEIIKGLHIPVPPLPLQRRFSALVEEHERLRVMQQEALRQAEHLFQTLLHDAFADGVA